MNPRGAGWAPTRTAATVALAGAFLAVSLASIGVSTPPSSPPGTAAPTSVRASTVPGPTWSNGVTTLAFASPFPTFSVTSTFDSRVSSLTVPSAIAEVGPSGNVSLIAHLLTRNVTWMFSSVTDPTRTTIWANGSVPVTGSGGGWTIGEAEPGLPAAEAKTRVSLVFFLNASNGPDPTTVRFAVNVTNWPWANASDSLGLELGSTAAPSTTLAAGAAPNQLLERRSGTNVTVAALSWDSVAAVVYGAGTTNTSPVGTDEVLGLNGANSTIRLSFTAVRGGYTELEYDPLVQLSPLAFHIVAEPLSVVKAIVPASWRVTSTTLEAIGAGAVATTLLAALAWRSRSSRSSPD